VLSFCAAGFPDVLLDSPAAAVYYREASAEILDKPPPRQPFRYPSVEMVLALYNIILFKIYPLVSFPYLSTSFPLNI
jgi:hypothetical protein